MFVAQELRKGTTRHCQVLIICVHNYFMPLVSCPYSIRVQGSQFSGLPSTDGFDIIITEFLLNMEPLGNLLSTRDQLQSGCTISLLECLCKTREALASDTRDNIFSKLGMVETSAAAIAPRPNYHKSCGKVQVELVKNFLKREQDLYIICLAGVQAKQHQSPSWLPDWGPVDERPMYPLRCSWGKESLDWPTYKAAEATTPSVKLCSEIKIECEGVLFDEIDGSSGDPWGNYEDQRLVRQSKSKNCRYTTQETAFTALWRTVVANEGHSGSSL